MTILSHSWVAWTLLLFMLVFGSNAQQLQTDNQHFDYVVLGGGTAGLVVASRLSENPLVIVAVIEAGDFEGNNPNATNTTILGIAKNTRLDWQYKSAPQVFADNQSLIWSAGKGLGGSSLINGELIYTRAGVGTNFLL